MKELFPGGYQPANKEFETFTNRQDRIEVVNKFVEIS